MNEKFKPINLIVEPSEQFSLRCFLGFHSYRSKYLKGFTGATCERCGKSYWLRIPPPLKLREKWIYHGDYQI